MEGIFGLLVVVVGASVAFLIASVRSQERFRLWQAAADAAKLENRHMTRVFGMASTLTGTAGALKVTIETYRRGKHQHGTRVIIGGLRHGTYALSVRSEGVTSAIQKTFGEREIEVGDPVFDQAAYVQGAPSLIRAIFDAETRRAVQTLLDGTLHAERRTGSRTLTRLRASVSDNELRVDIPSLLFDSGEQWLPSILPQLLNIGERLRRPDDLAVRLAENARGEALETVRLANLRALTSEFPAQPTTRDALRSALADDSLAVRLHAAIALGPEGQAPLLDLTSEQAPDDVAARAIAALGQAFSSERAIARLRQARGAGQVATAMACIDVLAGLGATHAVDPLAEILASAGDALAVAAARALGTIGNSAAEGPLVAALGHESGDVRAAAADALGRVGTPLAVVPLRNASAAHRLDAAFRRAARQAIAEIQSRISGASPGQVSLADEHAGQVSLVEEDTRGRLSLEQGAEGAEDTIGAADARVPAGQETRTRPSQSAQAPGGQEAGGQEAEAQAARAAQARRAQQASSSNRQGHSGGGP